MRTGRAEGISGAQQWAAMGPLRHMRQFRGGGGFAGAIDSHHQDGGRSGQFDPIPGRMLAEGRRGDGTLLPLYKEATKLIKKQTGGILLGDRISLIDTGDRSSVGWFPRFN